MEDLFIHIKLTKSVMKYVSNKLWNNCKFTCFHKRKMDFIAKKEGGDVKPETEDTIVIRVCDSVRKLE